MQFVFPERDDRGSASVYGKSSTSVFISPLVGREEIPPALVGILQVRPRERLKREQLFRSSTLLLCASTRVISIYKPTVDRCRIGPIALQFSKAHQPRALSTCSWTSLLIGHCAILFANFHYHPRGLFPIPHPRPLSTSIFDSSRCMGKKVLVPG